MFSVKSYVYECRLRAYSPRVTGEEMKTAVMGAVVNDNVSEEYKRILDDYLDSLPARIA